MQRALREVRGTRVEIGEDRAIAAALESEAQVTRFAHRATAHLRRLVAIERELRRHRKLGIARPRCRQPPYPLGRAHQRVCLAGSFKSKRSSLRISSTSAEIPSPVRQLVNRNGLSPRMSFESCAISSRLAPTYGARSILLMTRMSDCVMPGPFLRGILSPAATSMT